MLHKIWAKAGVGWGGMITFLGLEHMVDATQDLRLGWGGVGWDDNVLPSFLLRTTKYYKVLHNTTPY